MQSCLSKITSIRERDLDLTQKYFAMLYVNDEVTVIVQYELKNLGLLLIIGIPQVGNGGRKAIHHGAVC